ncbi:MAG: FHA domain-containing protein [Nannocystaceae bacterium]
MATLRHLASGRDYPLASRHLIGRAPACALRVEDPGVSGYHAEIAWDGERWQVQDLGSRNGTTLGGEALPRGERAPLPSGVDLVLAGAVRLRLVDASPPALFARAADGEHRCAVDELLCLPADDAPEITLYRDLDGRWWIEDATQTRELGDLAAVVAGGRSWQLFAPSSLPMTREVDGGARLAAHELRFTVSCDGEHVELALAGPRGAVAIESRVHLALLLVLARARLSDAARLPESERGWVYREDLPRMLGVEPELINVWIHRARRQLARAKIADAAALVERRTATNQLRIGAPHLRIEDRGAA